MFNNILTSKPFESPITPKDATAPPGTVGGGTFITPASLVTFAGATFAIKILLAVITLVFRIKDNDQSLVPIAFGVSIFIGVVIFLLTITTDGAKPNTTNQWLGAGAVALINTLYLFLAAIGIPLPGSHSLSSSQNQNPTNPPAINSPAVLGIKTNAQLGAPPAKLVRVVWMNAAAPIVGLQPDEERCVGIHRGANKVFFTGC
jgi:hypothetical protein